MPVLRGCLFEGRPLETAHKAESWIEARAPECGGELPDIPRLDTAPGVHFTNDGRRSTQEYLASLLRIEEMLSERGIALGGGSRLDSYRRALAAFPKRESDSIVGEAMQSVFEVRQLAIIAEQLGTELSDVKLRELALGHFSPGTEPPSITTKGRDIQFELFVAAVLRRGGLRTLLKEPDAEVEVDSQLISIAAKRVKSANKMRKRFREAVEQIADPANFAIGGVVVMDVSALVNPQQLFLRVHSSHGAMQTLENRVTRILQLHEGEFRRRAGQRTCALLIHASVPVLWVGDSIGTVSLVRGVGFCEEADTRRELMHRLVGRLNEGLKGT